MALTMATKCGDTASNSLCFGAVALTWRVQYRGKVAIKWSVGGLECEART